MSHFKDSGLQNQFGLLNNLDTTSQLSIPKSNTQLLGQDKKDVIEQKKIEVKKNTEDEENIEYEENLDEEEENLDEDKEYIYDEEEYIGDEEEYVDDKEEQIDDEEYIGDGEYIDDEEQMDDEYSSIQESSYDDIQDEEFIGDKNRVELQNLNNEILQERMDQIKKQYEDQLNKYSHSVDYMFLQKRQQELSKKVQQERNNLENKLQEEQQKLEIQFDQMRKAQTKQIEEKKLRIQQQIQDEFEDRFNNEKQKLVQISRENLQNYQQLKQYQNSNKLKNFEQQCFTLRLNIIKKLIQLKEYDLDEKNQNNSVKNLEARNNLLISFNQYRQAIIESFEFSMQGLDQLNMERMKKENQIIKQQFIDIRGERKKQLEYQASFNDNYKKFIDEKTEEIKKNQLIARSKFKDEMLAEQLNHLYFQKLNYSKNVNLYLEDKEIKQIKIDNVNQFEEQKKQLDYKISSVIQDINSELQKKYKQMKHELGNLQIEKLEKQKSLHKNNSYNQLILEFYQDSIKLFQKQEDLKEIQDKKMIIIDKFSSLLEETDQIDKFQMGKFESKIKNKYDKIKNLKTQDKMILQEFQTYQKQLYETTLSNEQQYYIMQIFSFYVSKILELQNLFKEDMKDLSLSKFPSFELEPLKIQRLCEIPNTVYFYDPNFKQRKKWKAFALNQSILFNLQKSIWKKDKEKLKVLNRKQKKDISQLENQFQQIEQNLNKKEFKWILIQKQTEMIKQQQSQLDLHNKIVETRQCILVEQLRNLNQLHNNLNKNFVSEEQFDSLKEFYQYYKELQSFIILPERSDAEDIDLKCFQLPSQYSYISSFQIFDLQRILLI